MVDDPVGQPAGLAGPRRGQDQGLVFHAGDDALAEVRPAEADRVAGDRQDSRSHQGSDGRARRPVHDRAQPRPADGELGEVGVAGAGPQVQPDPPAQEPDPVPGAVGVPDHDPDHHAQGQQHARAR